MEKIPGNQLLTALRDLAGIGGWEASRRSCYVDKTFSR